LEEFSSISVRESLGKIEGIFLEIVRKSAWKNLKKIGECSQMQQTERRV
jgi:hypothetical protein